jgi:hypothetical protein
MSRGRLLAKLCHEGNTPAFDLFGFSTEHEHGRQKTPSALSLRNSNSASLRSLDDACVSVSESISGADSKRIVS